jgi:hypothetical protein
LFSYAFPRWVSFVYSRSRVRGIRGSADRIFLKEGGTPAGVVYCRSHGD